MNNLFGMEVIKTNEYLLEDSLNVSENVFFHSYNRIVDLLAINRLKD